MMERRQDRTAAAVAEVFVLLKELFGDEIRFLITNQSLYELFDLYESHLLQSIHNGTEEETFAEWHNDIASFRSAWLASDPSSTSRFHARELPVITESATHDAYEKCGRKKAQGRPSPRAGGAKRPAKRAKRLR